MVLYFGKCYKQNMVRQFDAKYNMGLCAYIYMNIYEYLQTNVYNLDKTTKIIQNRSTKKKEYKGTWLKIKQYLKQRNVKNEK